MNKRPQDDARLAQVIAFPIPLDWSGDVDGTVPAIEHVFGGGGEVVFLPSQDRHDSEGTPWKALDTDVDRLRHSLAGPARPNTEQAVGLVSPGAHMSSTLPAHDLTGERSTDVGTLAHRLIGQFAEPTSRWGFTENLPTLLQQTAYESIRAIPARRRVLAIESLSHAHRYLTSYVPHCGWTLLGVEYPCGDGRVDVAWQHTDTGTVFFDEVKTSTTAAVRRTPASWVKQARRYSKAGHDCFGDAFLGTRLLPVATPHTAVVVRATGAPVPITPTPYDPMRVKEVTR